MSGAAKYGKRVAYVGHERKRGDTANGFSEQLQGANYDPEEEEFIHAMERWMRKTKTRFPKFTDVLAVAKSLGYRKVEECSAS